MTFDIAIIERYWPMILDGFGVTLAVFGLSLVLSLALGVVVAFARMSKFRLISWTAIALIEVVRNIPFMVLLFVLFFILPFFGPRMSAFFVGVIALTVFGGAYFAEIIRAAIQSLPRGQLESARAVGMSYGEAMRHVVFPQMLGYFIPPATNQSIMLVKESSVLSTITVVEMTMAAQVVTGLTLAPIEVFLMISIMYWLLNASISRAAARLEAALQPAARRRRSAARQARAANAASASRDRR
ncbi:MAG: amino acid ABC transporter permease [Defluviicoccus sp.]|nr:amino acid ABC transporter permease [Defluviicoccus sp.]MDE0383326.1 amino acid ABC transporter permease [Defluviicoccus sp.]